MKRTRQILFYDKHNDNHSNINNLYSTFLYKSKEEIHTNGKQHQFEQFSVLIYSIISSSAPRGDVTLRAASEAEGWRMEGCGRRRRGWRGGGGGGSLSLTHTHAHTHTHTHTESGSSSSTGVAAARQAERLSGLCSVDVNEPELHHLLQTCGRI